jgi:predicted transcriptional regulator
MCARIQKLNAQPMIEIKQQEYDLLNEIAQDSQVTQASLAKTLGIAVGSVNWYIKRLVTRGWVKVSHLDRTRLQYDLTPEGMSVFTERAMQYAKDSLKTYRSFRQKARVIVSEMQAKGITQVFLDGEDEVMDILRLTCVEAGLTVCETPGKVTLKPNGHEYQVEMRE